MKQLPLVMEHRRLLGREDFLVSPCNLEAVEWVDSYPDWGYAAGVVVVGGPCSGKTHISWLFSEKSGAKVYSCGELCDEPFDTIVPTGSGSALAIDDIDRAAGDAALEESLFHIINYSAECNTKLFLTSAKPAGAAGFLFDDLKTRIAAFPSAAIYAPDDDLLKALLVKQFSERGIAVGADAVEYAALHMPRNGAAASWLVERADELSTAQKCRVGLSLVKKIIDELQ